MKNRTFREVFSIIAVAALLACVVASLAGCVASVPTTTVARSFNGVTKVVAYDGHEYLFHRQGNVGGFIHSASCPNPAHR